MNDREALLRAIQEQPDDDTPRLVYADWLEEHGEADRAEFIRVQCRLATQGLAAEEERPLRGREAALLHAHGDLWLGSADYLLPAKVVERSYRRGFLDQLHVRSPSFVGWEAHWAPVHPVLRHLTLSPERRFDFPAPREGLIPSLTDSRLTERLEALYLADNGIGDDGLRELVDSGRLENLCALGLARERVTDAGLLHLAGTRRLPALESLSIRGGTATFLELGRLLASPHLPNLSRLGLAETGLDPGGLAALTRMPEARRLRGLALRDSGLRDEHVAEILNSPHLGSLAALSLSGNQQLGSGVLTVIAAAPRLTALEELDLQNIPRLGDDGVEELTACDRLRLRRLDLRNTRVSGRGVQALARAECSAELEEFALSSQPGVGDAGATALAESRRVRRLRVLSLSGAGVGDEGARALARSEVLATVRHLSLDRGRLTDAGAYALAESPFCDALVALNVQGNFLTAKGVAALVDRFGAGCCDVYHQKSIKLAR